MVLIVSRPVFFYSAPSPHRVPSISCGTVCLPGIPCSPLNPLTSAPLYLYVLVGGGVVVAWGPSRTSDSSDLCPAVYFPNGGGGVVLLSGLPRAPPTPPTHFLCLYWWGRLVLIPGPSCAPLTLLSLYVLAGRGGVVTSPPSLTPKSTVVFFLHVKSNSPLILQPKFPP